MLLKGKTSTSVFVDCLYIASGQLKCIWYLHFHLQCLYMCLHVYFITILVYCTDTAELSRALLHQGLVFPVYLSHFRDMYVAWMNKHRLEGAASGDWLVDLQSIVHLTTLESSLLYVTPGGLRNYCDLPLIVHLVCPNPGLSSDHLCLTCV